MGASNSPQNRPQYEPIEPDRTDFSIRKHNHMLDKHRMDRKNDAENQRLAQKINERHALQRRLHAAAYPHLNNEAS